MPDAPARECGARGPARTDPGMTAGRLRLAVVRQRYTPHGGAERFVERALGALAAKGADVTVIARRWETGVQGAAARIEVVDPFYAGRLWRDAGFARAAR